MLIDATADPYVPLVGVVAERTGASTLSLEGLGHWWMWEVPARRRSLTEFGGVG